MKIEIVKDIVALECLKESWNVLSYRNGHCNYYVSYSWFNAFLKCIRTSLKKPHIIVLKEFDTVIAIVPLSIKLSKGKLCCLKELQYIGNVYTPYWSAIYQNNKLEEIAEVIANYLMLKGKNEWDFIRLRDVSEADPFIIALDKALKKKGVKTDIRKSEANIQVPLSEYKSVKNYFNSLRKNFRQNIRTSINRLNRDGYFKIVIPHTFPACLDEVMDDYYDVYNYSWKDEEGDPEFHRKLAHIMKREKKLRLFQLYFKQNVSSGTKSENNLHASWDADINDTKEMPDKDYDPIASLYYILHEGNAYCLKMSYKSLYNKYGAGTVLLWFSIKYMLENDSIKMVDFQKGEEKYKLQWGRLNEYRQCYSAFNPHSIRAQTEYYINYKVISKIKMLKNLVKI